MKRLSDEVVLNEKYKYVYEKEKKIWIPHIYGKAFPLTPDSLCKFYDTNLLSIAAMYDNYFWLSNPAEFNDPFDCNLNLIEFDKSGQTDLETINKKNNLSIIGVTCFTTQINEPLFWAHYARNYNGFAIDFNPQSLTVSINNQELKRFSLNPVLYFDKFIKVK